MLVNLGVDSVLVCGFTTSGCVRATAVDALQCNFRLVVVRDACGDRDPEAHAANLRDLGLKYGDVLTADEALSKLPAGGL
jgi:nicotinamidase-related amidase